MSRVSRLIRWRRSSAWALTVRMLWRRSASLISTTRMSSAMATSILRMFSAWACSRVWTWILPSLVTPSTSRAIASPNSSRISSRVTSVSSTVSWRSAAASVSASRRSSLSRTAAATGCST